MKWYIKAFKNFTNFEGRATRTEYWMFNLFQILIFVGISLLTEYIESNHGNSEILGIVLVSYFFISLIPSLALSVRRLHDINKNGGWFFIRFVPFIGGIWYLILMVTDGTRGSNNYGPDPKNQVSNMFEGTNILDGEI